MNSPTSSLYANEHVAKWQNTAPKHAHMLILALICALGVVQVVHSFRPLPHLARRSVHGSRSSKLQTSFLDHVSSQLIAAGGADYASEIENAVGEEIYGPIFKAGIFLFVSGIVAAFGVAFIVSNSDTWNELEDEFDAGKQKQLIPSDADSSMATTSTDASGREPIGTKSNDDTAGRPRNEADSNIDDLDL